ncbi:rod shape-determining protein MreD [Streptococcus catagoni]|uniref:rod shape-determining protein MreD n=1 Tax=Streptococcus catagoni TaxID=2654874 RepID=UPI00140B9302|nr:rod shape-determining protein MreD [Streptococcus catagoni]
MTKKSIFNLILLLPLMLLDPHISEVLNLLLPAPITVTSLVFVVCYFWLSLKSEMYLRIVCSLILGMIFDYYYFDFLGVMILALPLATIILLVIRMIMPQDISIFQSLLLFSIFLFVLLFVSYYLLELFRYSGISLPYFITYKFLPTLLYNLVIFVTLSKYFQ